MPSPDGVLAQDVVVSSVSERLIAIPLADEEMKRKGKREGNGAETRERNGWDGEAGEQLSDIHDTEDPFSSQLLRENPD
ncbi:hypothetical protein Trydic_g15825 [Trypoxylus dichotomus]